MATVTTPVPPPVKNDWLSSGAENPRLSPPSPGGPRKAAPVQQVMQCFSEIRCHSLVIRRNGSDDRSL